MKIRTTCIKCNHTIITGQDNSGQDNSGQNPPVKTPDLPASENTGANTDCAQCGATDSLIREQKAWTRIPGEPSPLLTFYGEYYEENLKSETLHEALINYVERLPQFGSSYTDSQPIRAWLQQRIKNGQVKPKVNLYRYIQLKPSYDARSLVEHLVEQLDEEYGDPDGPELPTNAVERKWERAAAVFIKTVLEDYHGWVCDVAEKFEIDILEHLRENPHL